MPFYFIYERKIGMSKFVKNIRFKNHEVTYRGNQLHFNENSIAEIQEEHADTIVELNGYILVNEDGSEYVEDTTDDNSNSEDINSMTVKQLIRYAAKENIDLGSASKREDILNVILQAKQES
jgi:hypothetical protein